MYINESGNYTLSKERITGKYIFANGTTYYPVLYLLEDNNQNPLYAYCIDKPVSPKDLSKYSAMNLLEVPKINITERKANCVRNILLNSYPYIDINEVSKLSNVLNLTSKECIAATQLAVWAYTDYLSYDWELSEHPDQETTKELYDWYKSLLPVEPADEVAHLEINPLISGLNLDIAYRADRNNFDGSVIEPTYKFDRKIISQDLGKDDKGYYHVLAIDPPSGTTFTVNAEQNMKKDAYMLFSVNGISASQTLAAVSFGYFELSQSSTFEFGTLKIDKVDDKNIGLANAVFDIYSGSKIEGIPEFSNLVSTKLGVVEVPKMFTGKYMVKETRPPIGYSIKENSQSVLIIKDETVSIRFENSPIDPSDMGTIKIMKYSDLGNPLEKAIFNVYYGTDTSLMPYYKDLPTDKNGIIVIKNVAPAEYTVVETKAPDGYIPLEKGKIIEVLSGEESETSFINISDSPQQFGGIAIIKTNTKGEPLSDAVFNVYVGFNASSKNFYKTMTTDIKGLAELDDVPIGKYTLVEKKSPVGYFPLNNPVYIEVLESEVTKVNLKNIKISTSDLRELSISNLFESVALEQTALSHILNAEGEKMQRIFEDENSTNCDIVNANKSVKATVNSISKLELMLQNKLNLFEEVCLQKRHK